MSNHVPLSALNHVNVNSELQICSSLDQTYGTLIRGASQPAEDIRLGLILLIKFILMSSTADPLLWIGYQSVHVTGHLIG